MTRITLPQVAWVAVPIPGDDDGWLVAFEHPCTERMCEWFPHGHVYLIDEDGGHCRMKFPFASKEALRRRLTGQNGSWMPQEVAVAVMALPRAVVLPDALHPGEEEIFLRGPLLLKHYGNDIFSYP